MRVEDERRISSRRLPVLALALLMAALAGGCGDEQSTPKNDSADESAPATPAATRDDGLATAAAIRRRIVDHTVTGQMSASGMYTEYYAPDGSVHGPNYTARWKIENDQMCLDYDEAPGMDCYDVRFDADMVEWIRNGESEGRGQLVPGNPNDL